MSFERDEKGLFVTGTAPGPGRPRLTEMERSVRESQRSQIATHVEELTGMTVQQFHKHLESRRDSMSVLELAIAGALRKAMRDSNLDELHRLWDRLLGRPAQPIENGGQTVQTIRFEIVDAKENGLQE